MAYVGMLKWRFNEAATSSCVESGFDAQSTMSAPPSRNAIIKLAVSLVTCRQAETRSPFSGCSFANRLRMDCNTGICCAAHSILRLPASASPMSFTSPFLSSAVAILVLLEFEISFARAYCAQCIPASGRDAPALEKETDISDSVEGGN